MLEQSCSSCRRTAMISEMAFAGLESRSARATSAPSRGCRARSTLVDVFVPDECTRCLSHVGYASTQGRYALAYLSVKVERHEEENCPIIYMTEADSTRTCRVRTAMCRATSVARDGRTGTPGAAISSCRSSDRRRHYRFER